MVAPTLKDYEYQFTDNGFLLNGGATLPFVDVHSISGLDMPDVDSREDERDGAHGMSIVAKFVSKRVITIDGTLYADPETVSRNLDQIKQPFIPRDTPLPFYFKEPGQRQRYVNCIPTAFKYNRTNTWNSGVVQLQMLLEAGDPRIYEAIAFEEKTVGQATVVSNLGNVSTYPTYKITGQYTTVKIWRSSPMKEIVFSYPATANTVTEVDLLNREVRVNGVNRSANITKAEWWECYPGLNSTNVSVTHGAGSVPAKYVAIGGSAWL